MNISKIMRVAGREYASTALTKGFIIGVFVFPAIMLVVMPVLIGIIRGIEAPRIEGTIAVIDRTGLLSDGITREIELKTNKSGGAIDQAASTAVDSLASQAPPEAGEAVEQATEAIEAQVGSAEQSELPPAIEVRIEATDADLEALQEQVRQDLKAGKEGAGTLLGVLEIDSDAVDSAGDNDRGVPTYGGFTFFPRQGLSVLVNQQIESAARDAIRAERYDRLGENRARLQALTTVSNGDTTEITPTSTRTGNSEITQIFIPAAFMFMLLISVLTGGQYLLTTTVEEKSSRVIEILLSAVSSMELMVGKIAGQMAVGFTLMTVYGGLGIVALAIFVEQSSELIGPLEIVALGVFFVIAYATVGSLMAAIGSSVNELREAQSLMTPIMLALSIPYFLFVPVALAPSAWYSTTLSFVPLIAPFIMVMRIASTEPPPMWEIGLSLLVSGTGAVICMWLAAKIFRVGLLMFGKPPSLGTLIKWVRMA